MISKIEGRRMETYLATVAFSAIKTAANSFTRWGRLPVFSSWSMTATTISSLMPSVSIFGATPPSKGDGGGVCSNKPFRLARNAEFLSDNGSGDKEVCDRFTFFAGGKSSVAWAPFEREGDRREEFGRWMPNDGRDSDLRRVLYGMMSEEGRRGVVVGVGWEKVGEQRV